MFFKSLKKEMLLITLGLTIFISVITFALGVFSTQTAGSGAETATGTVLREQAEEILTQITASATDLQDLVFEQTKNDAGNLAVYMKNIYDNPTFYGSSYWRFDDRIFKEEGRYLNRESDISTVFVPSFTILDAREKRKAELSSYLDFVAPGILESNDNAVAVYHTDARGLSRYFPNIVLGKVAPPHHNTLEDVVFAGAMPVNNPDKKVVWSPLYDDPAGRGLMITASAPVYAKSGFEGVIGIDVLLNDIIAAITSYSPIEGSYAILVDKEGNTVAFPEKAYADILGRARTESEVRTNLTTSTLAPEFATILKEMMTGGEGFGSIKSQSANRELFLAYAPLEQTGLSMAVIAEKDVMLRAVASLHSEIKDSIWNTIVKIMFPASLFIVVLTALMSLFFVTKIVDPIQELTRGAREIGKGNFDHTLNVKSKNEIGELATSFTQMSQDLKKSRQELYEYSLGLEEKVKERTQSLAEANARQEGLIHFISHEVKGALGKCAGILSLIFEGDYGSVSEKMKEAVSRGLSDTRTAVGMVTTLLLSANVKSGALKFDMQPFDLLKDAIEPIFNELRQDAIAKGLTMKLEPKITQACRIVGDKEMLSKHVVRNLIDNAVRYTPHGEVSVQLECANDKAIMKVKDSGVGITEEDKARLFTEGGRGKDSIKVNVNSTGFGLFFAKQLVETHKGSIRAESEGQGKGSTFIVELPLAKSD